MHEKFYASFDANSLFYVEESWHEFLFKSKRKLEINLWIMEGRIVCPSKDCKKISEWVSNKIINWQ